MKVLLTIFLLFFSTQLLYSQEDDGVVSLALPVRNSLKFNRSIVNPTFSFVREQNKYVSIYNKREWGQFENAPLTYMVSYSGRFRENIGIGISAFQQNYGVLTTFGGILNFAYNIQMDRESNLTFGLNMGFHKSGLNSGKVITNVPDPSLENIPSNFLLTANPGINYGTAFFDFGLSLKNLVQYNLNSSELIKEDPEQSIQAHIMYTGYMDAGGFFYESKFSGLLRSEFKNDATVFSGTAMLTIPKGIWGQIGYNTIYGASVGLGLNISSQIAVEYNYEKPIGDLSNFGPSHDITLAYRFKNNNNYYYSGNDDESASIIPRPRKVKRPATKPALDANARAELAAKKAQEKANKEAEAQRLADEKAAADAAAEAQRLADEKAAADAAAEAQRLADEKAAADAAAEAQRLADEKAAADAERLALNPTDDIAKSLSALTKSTEASKTEQAELLTRLSEAVANKNKDLADLKEENDLSEKGIYKAPKAFKSVTAEKRALRALETELDGVIKGQNEKIEELEDLYAKRLKKVSDKNDPTNQYYQKAIATLKTEQLQVIESRRSLIATLEDIKVALEIERKRRIKRAAYDNEQDRFVQNKAALQIIKQNTPLSPIPLKAEDFDFGEEQSDNIQILKNVTNVEDGYYLIVAVHSNVAKRDDFLTKAVASGESNIDFFHDVNTSKYYIYYSKFDTIREANDEMKSKGNKPYNGKMSIIKIEN